MEFMSAYKRLDRLCHEIYPNARNGVSGYIEEMEKHPAGFRHVRGWEADYKALKHYRWVRNQIAHDEYADEETMCIPGDTEWLENFYQRIMTQTDPLALDFQASKPHPKAPASVPTPAPTPVSTTPPPHRESVEFPRFSESTSNPIGCGTLFVAVLCMVLMLLACFLL